MKRLFNPKRVKQRRKITKDEEPPIQRELGRGLAKCPRNYLYIVAAVC